MKIIWTPRPPFTVSSWWKLTLILTHRPLRQLSSSTNNHHQTQKYIWPEEEIQLTWLRNTFGNWHLSSLTVLFANSRSRLTAIDRLKKKKEHTEQKGRIHLVWYLKEMKKWEESFFRKKIVGLLKRGRKSRKIWVKELVKSVLGSFWYQFRPCARAHCILPLLCVVSSFTRPQLCPLNCKNASAAHQILIWPSVWQDLWVESESSNIAGSSFSHKIIVHESWNLFNIQLLSFGLPLQWRGSKNVGPNDHPEDPASCKWLSRGSGHLQMIIWRDRPLANDHPEDPAFCKWSSGGSGLLQMVIWRDWPLTNDHPSPPSP